MAKYSNVALGDAIVPSGSKARRLAFKLIATSPLAVESNRLRKTLNE